MCKSSDGAAVVSKDKQCVPYIAVYRSGMHKFHVQDTFKLSIYEEKVTSHSDCTQLSQFYTEQTKHINAFTI